jgi:hypothetical protein
MKIISNLMTTVLNVLTAEVLTLPEAIGLDRDPAIEIMSGTAVGQRHMTTTYPDKVFKDDLSPAFIVCGTPTRLALWGPPISLRCAAGRPLRSQPARPYIPAQSATGTV